MNRRALGVGLGLLASTVLAGCRECTEPALPPGPEPNTADDPSEPPRLVDGQFLDASTVELVFTEPMAPPDEVEPGAFRMSVAKSSAYGGYGGYGGYGRGDSCDHYTDYYDLTDGTGFFYGCYYGYYSYDYGCDEPTRVIALALVDGDARRLRLTIAPPLSSDVCNEVANAGERAGIFVHYGTNASIVTDAGGQALAEIAPHWALSGERNVEREGVFADMDAFMPIPCPGA